MIIEEREKKCNRWPKSSRCLKKIKAGECPIMEKNKRDDDCKGGETIRSVS